MNQTNETTEDQTWSRLTRELRITRIFCGISSLLTLLMLIGGVFAAVKVQNYATELAPVAEELSQLDAEEFNRTLANVNATLTSAEWEKFSASLSALDVEALNGAIANLDTAELTEALKNLNEAASTMEELGGRLEQITSMFKR